MPTNLEAPHGATIAYSRLCNAYAAAADLLVVLTPLAGKTATESQIEGVAAAFATWEAAHQQHTDARAWANAEAPAQEANG